MQAGTGSTHSRLLPPCARLSWATLALAVAAGVEQAHAHPMPSSPPREPTPISAEPTAAAEPSPATAAMAADHPLSAAAPYLASVRRWAREYQLPESLLLAMIHTESRFNPQARSGANALGLMQLIPEYAGADAWAFLTGEKRVPSDSELLDPDTNIRLGAAYLRMLREHYWRDIDDPALLQALMLASYNWGVGNLLRRLKSPFDLATLEKVIERSAPRETVGYLRVVRQRARHYEVLLLADAERATTQLTADDAP